LIKVTLLTIDDLETLYTFECETWPAGARASKESLTQRFKLHHWIFAAWENEIIIGILCWRHGWFDPNNMDTFPINFNDFANVANDNPFNSAFAYNLSVHPNYRGLPIAKHLLNTAMIEYHNPNWQYLVGDGRCPSYNGSNSDSEKIEQRLNFKQVIDGHLQRGIPLNLEDYLIDPVLCFYHRLLNCHFTRVIEGFLPTDIASGGNRVIFYKKLM